MKDEQQPDLMGRLRSLLCEMRGHQHFDRTGQSGLGCDACQRQHETSQQIEQLFTEAVQGYVRERDEWKRKFFAEQRECAEFAKSASAFDAELTEARAEVARLTEELADAEQQLEVLRPGGTYAWKTRAEAAEQREQALRDENARKDENLKIVSDELKRSEHVIAVLRRRSNLYKARAEEAEDELQALRDGLREASEPLRQFVERERDVRDSINKGGQHVGYTARVTPTVLRMLEELIAPLDALLTAPAAQECPECHGAAWLGDRGNCGTCDGSGTVPIAPAATLEPKGGESHDESSRTSRTQSGQHSPTGVAHPVTNTLTEVEVERARTNDSRRYVCFAIRGKTDPPQDCDWPFCGCDEHASKVIGALQECGWGPAAPAGPQEQERPNYGPESDSWEDRGWPGQEAPGGDHKGHPADDVAASDRRTDE